MKLNRSPQLESAPKGKQDKQLCTVALADVLQKRQLDQALNAKEFAVLAGISYSTARDWFRMPGFPVFRGVVFWGDFAQWRTSQNRARTVAAISDARVSSEAAPRSAVSLPARAARMLVDAR